MKSLTLNDLLSALISLGLVMLIFLGISFIALSILSACVVPLTWIWGLITDQSYDRVCDNSQFIWQLNQIGKWTIAILLGFLILFLLTCAIL